MLISGIYEHYNCYYNMTSVDGQVKARLVWEPAGFLTPCQMAVMCGLEPLYPADPRPSVILEYKPTTRKRKYFELSAPGGLCEI